MFYAGKLLCAELYDDSTYPYTNVKAVWEANKGKHAGKCVVVNAHWHNPGPKYIGNYKINGHTLSEQYPGMVGLGWNEGQAPQMSTDMGSYRNFVSTIPAIVNGVRQNLSYGGGVERATTRTWFGRDAAGNWSVEVTTSNYTLDGIVDRMESLGIIDGIVFDGSGSSQWYDGRTYVRGDGRIVYSYLILWFADGNEGERLNYKKGIDVSYYQGDIDWSQVSQNVDFAILRAGYGQNNIDKKFVEYANACTQYNIPFGVYWFSYAYTEDMARREAQYCLQAVAPYKLSYPIAFDFEYDSVRYANDKGVIVSKSLASSMARAFLNEIEAAGYYGTLYANADYLASYFESDMPSRYDIWYAQWPYILPAPEDKPTQAGGMWQYTSNGSLPGISTRVDMNYAYKDYPAIIASLGGGSVEPTPEPQPEPDPTPTPTPIPGGDDDMTYEQFKEYIERYEKEKQLLPGSSWSVADCDWAVKNGMFEGSDVGFMWRSPCTREELAALFHRYDTKVK